jgi:Eukaryotic aspartyl protease
VEIEALQMGLALSAPESGSGLMGIGYDTDETSDVLYPSVIDQMVSQKLINSKTYSLWLNDIGDFCYSCLY